MKNYFNLWLSRLTCIAFLASAAVSAAVAATPSPTPRPTLVQFKQCDAGLCRPGSGDDNTCSSDNDCGFLICDAGKCIKIAFESTSGMPGDNQNQLNRYNLYVKSACSGKSAGDSCQVSHKECVKARDGGIDCVDVFSPGIDTCTSDRSCNEQEYHCQVSPTNSGVGECVRGDKADPNKPAADQCSPIASVGAGNSCNRLACKYSMCTLVGGTTAGIASDAQCVGQSAGARCNAPTPTPTAKPSSSPK